MSDSVDRVFSHALNTVNKIRTGSQKPPSATRLKLYGLYKQAMEGDVDGIMERPEGSGDEVFRAREKWDAWKQQNGLSRTEAKRRYITTLIETMHKYASPSPDSRELVAELEFVWDQVKSNVPSSSSSSPLQTLGSMGLHIPPGYPGITRTRSGERAKRDEDGEDDDDERLQIRSPMSQSEEDELEAEAREEEEFVDAPDSQYNPATDDTQDRESPEARRAQPRDLAHQPPTPLSTRSPKTPTKAQLNPSTPPRRRPLSPSQDPKWRKRIEATLIKMTAEVAALREQLEARRLFQHSRTYTAFRFVTRLLWGAVKHVAINLLLLGFVLLWMRWRRDGRLEGVLGGWWGVVVEWVRRVRVGEVMGVDVRRLRGRKGR